MVNQKGFLFIIRPLKLWIYKTQEGYFLRSTLPNFKAIKIDKWYNKPTCAWNYLQQEQKLDSTDPATSKIKLFA